MALQFMQTSKVCNGPSEDGHLERSDMWMASCVSVCGHNYNKHVDGELCSVCGHNYNKHVDGELCVCLWTQLQ